MIWVIAGTQDGREIAAALADREGKKKDGRQVFVTVVSQYGKELAAHEGLTIAVGRFTEPDMVRIIRERHISVIVDASHPYAAIVSETARAAVKETGISYVRYERPEVSLPAYEKLYHAGNEEEAAEKAGALGKKILLTTGSKTLPVFAKASALQGKEMWCRVLPTSAVVKECEDLGIKAKYIIAMQGPFSYEMNRAMIHDKGAEVVVMKNSGLIGGSDTKLKAAMDEGAAIVVIDRPKASAAGFPVFDSPQAILHYMEEYDGVHKKSESY